MIFDGDGDLDLAIDGWYPRIFLNTGGTLSYDPVWGTNLFNGTASDVAWGDVDGDGDLDLAVGVTFFIPNQGRIDIFLNEQGTFSHTPTWSQAITASVSSLAWGDVNGDGYLDLAVGQGISARCEINTNETCYYGSQNRLYLNQNGQLNPTPHWQSAAADYTTSLAWGDVNGDGYLDLAVGNGPFRDENGIETEGQNKVYLNVNGTLLITPSWTTLITHNTSSVAWGDVDNDGDLDLAVGNLEHRYGGCCIAGIVNELYLNISGVLEVTPTWTSTEESITTAVDWGDVDNDGDLDLAVSNWGKNEVYLNKAGGLSSQADWTSTDEDISGSIAWGDIDGDGDLDLAAVSDDFKKSHVVYLNQGIGLQQKTSLLFSQSSFDTAVAWGDVDNDGDVDLAVGQFEEETTIYLNENGQLANVPAWTSGISASTESLAWGDVNGDGRLDLAIGNREQENAIYVNQAGSLALTPVWTSNDGEWTASVAWGDVDGDGDLDLAVGNEPNLNYERGHNSLFLNENGTISQTPVWTSADNEITYGIAWGDMDGDGDLDLAAANWFFSNRVYINENGRLQANAVWKSFEEDYSFDVAWGDVDGDGDLDLAVANASAPNRIYLNVNGVLDTEATWSSDDYDYTPDIEWGDVNGDGYLDLVAGNYGQDKIYLNRNGILQTRATWIADDNDATESVALGDMDNDGDLDLGRCHFRYKSIP